METFLYDRLMEKAPKINLWWAYPAIYSFAMSSLGYLDIFKMMDLDPELYVERIYTDSKIIEIPYKDVDAMGFSVSFELDILSIIKMLKKYDFPLKSLNRGENDPIIFAGGPVLMSNPVPFENLFDFISIGEKVSLKKALDVLKNKREKSRDEILKELSNLEGIYVPKYPKKEVKIERDEIENSPVYTPILSEKSFFKDTFVLELERGCPKMCNFCLASWLNLPTRFVKYEKIIEAIDLGLKYTDKLALLGAYVAGHPDFDKIISYISKKCEQNPIELSISSLRADLADVELIKTLVKCGQKTATIALEAASQRLRDYIKKDLTEAQILKTLDVAQKNGLKGMKIYAMLGLPTETDDDIEEFITLCQKIKKQIKENKTQFDITISASTFIPKPHTPFENAIRCDKKILEKRINYLKKNLHKLGITFRASSVDWDDFQSILSNYDDDLVDFLEQVVLEGGTIGTFKQLWRKKNKNEKKEKHTEKSACFSLPLYNNKVLKCNFINTNSNSLKLNRQKELY